MEREREDEGGEEGAGREMEEGSRTQGRDAGKGERSTRQDKYRNIAECRDTVTITNRELERKKKKCAGGKKQKPANSMRLDGAAEGCLTARRDQWKLSFSPPNLPTPSPPPSSLQLPPANFPPHNQSWSLLPSPRDHNEQLAITSSLSPTARTQASVFC